MSKDGGRSAHANGKCLHVIYCRMFCFPRIDVMAPMLLISNSAKDIGGCWGIEGWLSQWPCY